jgi:dipeptide/tripeptide permease
MRWTLALIVLVVAVLINTVLLDELVTLLDENIGIAKVSIKRNLGFRLAMASSGFALIALINRHFS